MDENFTIEDLRRMRFRLKVAFKQCYTHPINTSDYFQNDHYPKLIGLIKAALGLQKQKGTPKGIPMDNWFIDVFKKDVVNKNPNMLATVISALDAYESKPFRIVKEEIVYLGGKVSLEDLKGITNIDNDFIEKIKYQDRPHSRTDFYLGISDEDCQWYGVMQGWDEERNNLFEIKEKIKYCFSWKNSKVAAVIWGTAGCGKSTLLRKLAISSFGCSYKVLWVDDMYSFCADLNEIDDKEKFLIFIDDWFEIHENSKLVSQFISKISATSNIRVIIGDREIQKRPYKKLVYEGNYFEITASENEKIIRFIANNYPDWQDAANRMLFVGLVSQAPLFIVIFVIARLSDTKDYEVTKDVYGMFSDIIEGDFRTLNEHYPSLTKSILYWIKIHEPAKVTQSNKIDISWEALLYIADHYNGSSSTREISRNFALLKKDNAICKLISNYISIKPYNFPVAIKARHSFEFHHMRLVEDGLKKLKFDEHFYDDNLIYEFFNILTGCEDKASAAELYYCIMRKFDIDDLRRQKLVHKFSQTFGDTIRISEMLSLVSRIEFILLVLYPKHLSDAFLIEVIDDIIYRDYSDNFKIMYFINKFHDCGYTSQYITYLSSKGKDEAYLDRHIGYRVLNGYQQ